MQEKINLDKVYSYTPYSFIDEIAAEWKQITTSLSVFYTPEFLKAIENAPPTGLENRYILVHKNGDLVGVVYCQLKSFSARDSISFKEKPGIVNKVGNSIKNGINTILNFEGLVCGSILLTGMYAYHFLGESGHKEDFLLAEKIVESYRLYLNKNGRNIKVTFLKDFYADKKLKDYQITETRYKEFSVQPNMILKLRKEWNSYEDYLAAFQSKYRVRAKRARKKMVGVILKELDYVDIRKYNTEIYALYRNIVDNINFNLFFLHDEYFAELKKNMKDKFRLFGYFKNEKLVAFYTCIDNKSEMNAHFLGYDPDVNKENQLYLNSLYDMVELSLKYNFETINFSRTAMEIKSSMGAEPFDMLCYLKHQSNLINTGVAKIVDALNPTEEWVQRRPFKEEA
jgi:predicted N-acyltransferase